MGNQQGLQLCTTHHDNLLSERFMVDKDFRIDYKNTEILPRKELGVVQHQQRFMNVACQEQEPEEIVKVQLPKSEIQFVAETRDVLPLDQKLFKGLFGEIKLLVDGHVQYTDCTGRERRDVFDRAEIRKTFPLGISLGGLTKSLWFKEAWERDLCFQCMSALEVGSEIDLVTDYEKANDDLNYNVFAGIEGKEVFVYPDNHVVYTDVYGETHNVSYKKSKIQKCFPNGICFGGLPRTIWFKGETEQQRCFFLMKQSQQEQSYVTKEEEDEQVFSGLYGNVMLKPDYEIEFTSLLGDRLISYYDPRKIRKVFPMGIASNTFPSTIWFDEMEECESCYRAMKETL